MQKLLKLPRAFWILIILGFIVIVLIFFGFSFLRKQEPPFSKTTLATPIIAGEPLPQNVAFNASLGSLPKELPAYRGIIAPFSPEKALQIAQKLGFTEPPRKSDDVTRGRVYLWATEEGLLSIGLDSPEINFSVNDLESFIAGKGEVLPGPSQPQEILPRFMSQLEVPFPFRPDRQKISYLKIAERGFTEVDQQNADSFRLEAPFLLGDHPLIGNSPSVPAVSLLLRRDGEVASFYYRLYFSQFSAVGSFSLKNPSQILSSLTTEGKLVSLGISNEGGEIVLSSVVLTQASLAYFQPANPQKPIQPIYILGGEGVLPGGQKTEVVVYLPAFVFE